jgi:hypothetical protein
MKSQSGTTTVILMIAVLSPILIWLWVKIDISRSASPHTIIQSNSRDCTIRAYTPKLSKYGVIGDLIRLFSSPTFYRVYSKEGVILRTSEWLFLQREFSDTDTAKWIHSHVIYPTNSGYEGWKIPDCG